MGRGGGGKEGASKEGGVGMGEGGRGRQRKFSLLRKSTQAQRANCSLLIISSIPFNSRPIPFLDLNFNSDHLVQPEYFLIFRLCIQGRI